MGKENSKLRFGFPKCLSFLTRHRCDCLPRARHQGFFSFIKSGMLLLQAIAPVTFSPSETPNSPESSWVWLILFGS